MAVQTLTTVNSFIFLCNPNVEYFPETGGVIDNRRLPELIKFKISQGEPFVTDWRCANTKSIEVGDRAYLLKTVDSPTGIIAVGKVIAAPEELQLRKINPKLSAAYVGQYGDNEDNYYVCLALDSVVDFDYPLELRLLKSKPLFKGVNFYFAGSGKRFAPDNLKAIQALASEWEEHSLQCHRRGKGRRLVNVLLENGDAAKESNDDQTALYYYQQALLVDPNYGLALSKEKNLRNRIERNTATVTPPPAIVDPPDPIAQPTAYVELTRIQTELEHETASNAKEEQRQVLTYIARRLGQTQFRQALLEAYGSKCAITGFDAEAALEAAHIVPYAKTGNNHPSNGILLRADLHTLFDLNLLAIDPETLQLFLHPDLRHTEYRTLHGQKMRIPATETLQPDKKFLKERLQYCTWLNIDQP